MAFRRGRRRLRRGVRRRVGGRRGRRGRTGRIRIGYRM